MFTAEQRSEIRNVIRSWVESLTWIPVTYINSWEDYGKGYTPTAYYKDIMGNVHLRLACKNGITANPFVIPSGYRPAYTKSFPILSVPSGTTVVPYIRLVSDGTVVLANYDPSYCVHGEIIYRAA